MTGPAAPRGLDEAFVWDVGDAVVDLSWSGGGALSAVTAAGRVCVIDGASSSVRDVGGRLSQAWDPTGTRLAVVSQDGVHLFSHQDGSLPSPPASPPSGASRAPSPSQWSVIDHPRSWGAKLAWSPSGMLAVASDDSVVLHGIAPGIVARTSTSRPAELPATVMDLAWLDAHSLCAATLAGTWLLDVSSAQRSLIGAEDDACLSLAVSPSGILAIGRAAGAVALHDGTDAAVDLDGYDDPRWSVMWDGIGQSVVTAEDDRLVVWNAANLDSVPARPTILRGHRAAVCCVAAVAGRALLASADTDGTLLVWAPDVSERAVARWGSGVAVHCCSWAPGGDLLAVGTDAGLSALIPRVGLGIGIG